LNTPHGSTGNGTTPLLEGDIFLGDLEFLFFEVEIKQNTCGWIEKLIQNGLREPSNGAPGQLAA